MNPILSVSEANFGLETWLADLQSQ